MFQLNSRLMRCSYLPTEFPATLMYRIHSLNERVIDEGFLITSSGPIRMVQSVTRRNKPGLFAELKQDTIYCTMRGIHRRGKETHVRP